MPASAAVIASMQGISEDIAERGVSVIDQASRDELTSAEWRQIARECERRGWLVDPRRTLVIAGGRYDQWQCPWLTVDGIDYEAHGALARPAFCATWVSVPHAHGPVQRPVRWTGTGWAWLAPESARG